MVTEWKAEVIDAPIMGCELGARDANGIPPEYLLPSIQPVCDQRHTIEIERDEPHGDE